MEIKKIIEGWKNILFTDEEIEKLSDERMQICNDCEFKQQMMAVDVCGMCHCPLIAKTRSPKSLCPKEKWLK